MWVIGKIFLPTVFDTKKLVSIPISGVSDSTVYTLYCTGQVRESTRTVHPHHYHPEYTYTYNYELN